MEDDTMDFKEKIRTVPNWPIEGVMFRDITTLLKDKDSFQKSANALYELSKDLHIDKVVGIDSMGYGKIPKLVMQDRRLTPEAKCIYGYFASYAGSGNSAFPSVSKILYDLCIGRARYYKHFVLLVDYGYIEVEQAKDSGKFSHNVYVLNGQIADKEPCAQNRTTVEPCTQNRTTGNRTTNTNSSKNNIEEEEEQTEKFPKKYIEMALKVGATKSDLAAALEKMDSEPDIKSPVAWLQKALENEVINRELVSRPKTKGDPKPMKSISARTAKKAKTDPDKYEKFYL